MMLEDTINYPNKKNWTSLVKKLLSTYGFLDVWLNQGVGDSNAFLSMFRQRISDVFIQNWRGRINDSSRALFYKNICDFKLQYYLKNITISKFRHAFAQLRVSSHRLEIEAGRWRRIPIENRMCSTCNCLADEFHFILECTRYTHIRLIYIRKYYRQRPNMMKFVELINSEHSKTVKNLCNYIYNAFSIRNKHFIFTY